MSVLFASGNNGLKATTNLSSPTNCTKLVWAQFASGAPTSYCPFLSSYDGGATHYNEFYGQNSNATLHTESGTANLSTTLTDWVCYAMTMTTAGAGSVIGYRQDASGGGFGSGSQTGSAFTISSDCIGGPINNLTAACTMAYYMEWSTVLSLTDLNTQFKRATPVVQLGSLRRYLAMTAGASAGTDTSGNGYNMTVVGSASNGASNPPIPAAGLLLLSA